MVDVRILWKQYLADHKLQPTDLLFDELHLNVSGNRLMADLVMAHLRPRPDLAPHFTDPVHTHLVGEDRDLQWKDGKLRFEFVGNKVEMICRDGAAPGSSAAIRIDGKKPSEFPELSSFTRTELNVPHAPYFPPILRLGSQAPRIPESWTLMVSNIDSASKSFRFKLSGSQTGEDGSGESGRPFVSNSKRVAIDPADFDLFHALTGGKDRDATEAVVQWKVVPQFADEFAVPEKRNPFGETVVVAAQGLTNGKHVIEIAGSPETPLAGLRVYRPTLPASPGK